jgi:hypothetical protein
MIIFIVSDEDHGVAVNHRLACNTGNVQGLIELPSHFCRDFISGWIRVPKSSTP